MERFGVISDEKLTEEIWADGGHYYLRQEWNNGWLSETGVNYNWVNPNEDKLDDKVFITNVEELEKLRTEALAKMPKRLEFESKLVYDQTLTTQGRVTKQGIGYYIPFTAPISLDNELMGKLKVIIEEVQE